MRALVPLLVAAYILHRDLASAVKMLITAPVIEFVLVLVGSYAEEHTSLLFFFQAEDGIRDPLVTEVQTCALPICSARMSARRECGSPPITNLSAIAGLIA